LASAFKRQADVDLFEDVREFTHSQGVALLFFSSKRVAALCHKHGPFLGLRSSACYFDHIRGPIFMRLARRPIRYWKTNVAAPAAGTRRAKLSGLFVV